ncbi:hypothetical protein GCM10028794_07350 [Silanimonas algicola]
MRLPTFAVVLFLALAPAALAAAPRIDEVRFVSHGATLSGSLVLPEGKPIVAGVVFIHGSGEQGRNLGVARRLADGGIAALVYDKRGVGRSGGVYEGEQSVTGMNISLLADDAVAALETLATQPGLDAVPLGFAGISQAGWIAPVAATRTRQADFLLLWSAPVTKVSEEDLYSKHTGDRDGADRPAYATALAARDTPYVWPAFLGRDTDPAEDLATLAIPGFWIFGEQDGSIPVDLSLRNLRALQAKGHRYEYRVFPGQGHNNMAATFDAAIAWVAAFAGGARSAHDGEASGQAR